MNKHDLNMKTAGILYLMSALFAAGTLGIWLFTPPGQTFEGIRATPGAVALLATIFFLLVSSIAMGSYLLVRARASKGVLVLSGLIACAGFAWNIIAVVFWLVPSLFVWRAYRVTHDN